MPQIHNSGAQAKAGSQDLQPNLPQGTQPLEGSPRSALGGTGLELRHLDMDSGVPNSILTTAPNTHYPLHFLHILGEGGKLEKGREKH